MNLGNKTVCVVDNGLFVSFARKLAKDFGHVLYYSPWEGYAPRSRRTAVGDGFDDITRINDPLSEADNIDLWCFLDLYHSDLQMFLKEQGARVWGSQSGEELELDRWEFKRYLERLGLPVAPSKRLLGTTALRNHLANVHNKWIKSSFHRGDMETFLHERMSVTEPHLNEIEMELGPLKEDHEFIVEDAIPHAVEIGYDGYCIDGRFPNHAMMAYEVKDCGMVGVALPYAQLAEPVRKINDAISPALRGYGFRGFISTEIRYTNDRKPFFIDPCCRLGTPSNELLQEMFDEWGTVLWEGANGNLVTPVETNKFGVLAVIHNDMDASRWVGLEYPKQLDQYVKLRFHTRVDGHNYVAPQEIGLPELGVVVGTGHSLLAAVRQCKERVEQLHGYGLRVSLESIDKALDIIKDGEALGIKFGDAPLPSHEAVRRA